MYKEVLIETVKKFVKNLSFFIVDSKTIIFDFPLCDSEVIPVSFKVWGDFTMKYYNTGIKELCIKIQGEYKETINNIKKRDIKRLSLRPDIVYSYFRYIPKHQNDKIFKEFIQKLSLNEYDDIINYFDSLEIGQVSKPNYQCDCDTLFIKSQGVLGKNQLPYCSFECAEKYV